ncbi:F-box/LRR-repeat protein 8-like [Amblyomma americanum]
MCYFHYIVTMEDDHKIVSYESLPEAILLEIFMKLSLPDRLQAALSCRRWCNIFTSPAAWTNFHFRFYGRKDTRLLQCIISYGCYLRQVVIELNQFQNVNRVNAVQALLLLAKCSSTRLSHLRIICTGENPLFYAGKEFVSALEAVFKRCNSHLVEVDLGKFPMMIDSHTIDVLSQHSPQLECLNIQNNNLVCLVQPECIVRLAQRCRRLRDLRVHKCSLSQDVLLCFLEQRRVGLEHLSLQCRSEEIIATHPQDEKTQLSSELWSRVVSGLPRLRVTLHFDQTCPLVVIPLVMRPEVPCAVLRLETFTIIHDMVLLAAYSYAETLEKLILQAPPSAELECALLEVSRRCSKLRALHVFCPLSEQTIDTILWEHPCMKASGLYTLRSEAGSDGPWATDEKVDA